MEEVFIEAITVYKARNLVDFDIPLSETERKHLIITGKNGSGKTSLLNELKKFLNVIPANVTKLISRDSELSSGATYREAFGGTDIRLKHFFFSSDYFQKGNFLLAFFEAKRNISFNEPNGVNAIRLKPAYGLTEFAAQDFIQYIVNLKADRSFAKDDNDLKTATKIDEWFESFEKSLFSLFDSPDIQLNFDRKNYNFNITEAGKEPYTFNQLSGGYAAILSIVTELILRMEEHRSKSYDVEGVVLIDEIETHLHIDLQKKILPFLTSFFPKIQFIVTTHSPFVLNSIDNAVICDLEKKIVTTDLSGYSYDTLIESYFGSDKYSDLLKQRVERYEILIDKNELTEAERDELFDTKKYLKEIPKFMSDELAVKLQQIKLKELSKRETA